MRDMYENVGSDDYSKPIAIPTDKFVNLMTGQKFRHGDDVYVKVPEVRLEGWIGPFFYNCVTEGFDAIRCHYFEPETEVEI